MNILIARTTHKNKNANFDLVESSSIPKIVQGDRPKRKRKRKHTHTHTHTHTDLSLKGKPRSTGMGGSYTKEMVTGMAPKAYFAVYKFC